MPFKNERKKEKKEKKTKEKEPKHYTRTAYAAVYFDTRLTSDYKKELRGTGSYTEKSWEIEWTEAQTCSSSDNICFKQEKKNKNGRN